ncbi:MAG: protein kinase [Bryobacteraceae bacterium]
MSDHSRSKETRSGDDDLVMGLVEEALSHPAANRERFVREACAGDASLFENVWRYVSWDERMEGFLQQPLYPIQEDRLLEPGQILEGRFRIERQVGGGGMGIVYEAHDEKLGRRIAIKCAKAGFHARLSPEVRLASEINHPNVCKTWEIHTASGTQGAFDFLTMEFIAGPTLAEALRNGLLPKEERTAVANQLCAGLAEAHRRHVIHGDLKPSNILLQRGPDGIRAVITDFGLARAWMAQGPAVMSGEPAGTLDYMAPELLKNGRPSAASDVYALGVILHELACGHAPFDASATLEQRMERAPPRLRHPWGRIIARCLEPGPTRRCDDASEVARALAPMPWLRWLTIAIVVVAAALAGAIGYRTIGVSRESVRLAFLPFATTTDNQALGNGILHDTADRLNRVKDERRKLTVIPVRDAIRNKADTPLKAATLLGATHVFTGTLGQDNGKVNVHAVLTDARSGLQLKEWDAQYTKGSLGNLPVALAGVVTGTLRFPPLVVTPTVNAAAYPDFSAGVGLLQGDSGLDAALPLLARAVAQDEDSPLTHARLAEAEARKYRVSLDSSWLDRAKKSLYDAQQRNPDLALVWLVSGRINEYRGFYEAAESDLQRALQIDPRDGDAWRRLAQVYLETNHFAEAEVAFRKAVQVRPGYFVYHQALCQLYTFQADYPQAIQQCQKTVQLAPDSSDAHFALAIPYFEAGEYGKSEAEFLAALKLDPMSSKALYSRAFALTSQGRVTEALPLFDRAIRIGPATHLLYSDLGTAFRLTGQAAKSRKAYSDGLSLAEKELEKNPRNVILRTQLAYICARLGQRSRAASEAIQARQLAPGSVEVSWWLIQTWDALGEQDEALAELAKVPDDMLRRIGRETDLADLRRSSRFKQLMASHRIQ